VQQRANLEVRGNAVVALVNSDQNVGSRQESYFGMAHVVCLAARHHEAEWLERALGQEVAKGLVGHTLDITLLDGECRFLLATAKTRE
jgi:hypothetical protein